jgi:hypothetical protein
MGKLLYGILFLCAALIGAVSSQPVRAAAEEPAAAAKRPLSPGQAAARERQKKCATEWKTAKASGKTEGQTWPKFWSACNTRLKGQGQ